MTNFGTLLCLLVFAAKNYLIGYRIRCEGHKNTSDYLAVPIGTAALAMNFLWSQLGPLEPATVNNLIEQ